MSASSQTATVTGKYSPISPRCRRAISNAVDLAERETREARYMEIVKRYDRDELEKFAGMMASLVLALEHHPSDILGQTFHDLELYNKYSGQYFTPYPICQMMAKMTLSDDVEKKIEARGYVTASEPAVGSGGMVIALAQEMQGREINYQQRLHVTATDVDPKCVHMAYVQFSLLHIPAIVVHGNSLSLEEFGRWYTPAHLMGGWKWRLARQWEQVAQENSMSPQPSEANRDKPSLPPHQLTLF